MFDIDLPFYEYLSTNITMNILNTFYYNDSIHTIIDDLHTSISNHKKSEIKFGYNMLMFMSPYEIAQNVF